MEVELEYVSSWIMVIIWNSPILKVSDVLCCNVVRYIYLFEPPRCCDSTKNWSIEMNSLVEVDSENLSQVHCKLRIVGGRVLLVSMGTWNSTCKWVNRVSSGWLNSEKTITLWSWVLQTNSYCTCRITSLTSSISSSSSDCWTWLSIRVLHDVVLILMLRVSIHCTSKWN
jgi:hypothetical protein